MSRLASTSEKELPMPADEILLISLNIITFLILLCVFPRR